MIARTRPSALAVLSPSHLHMRHVKVAIEANLPSMVIRPATVRPEAAQSLAEAARRAGVSVLVGHELAWTQPVPQFRRLLAAGGIGELTEVTLISEGGDGDDVAARPMPEEAGTNLAYVYETAMHDIIIAHSLTERSAVVATRVQSVFACHARPQLDAVLEHASGVHTQVRWDSSPDLPFRRVVRLVGRLGTATWQARKGSSETTLQDADGERALALRHDGPTDQAGAVVHRLMAMLAGALPDHGLDDAAMVQNGTRLLIDAVAARLSVAVDDSVVFGIDDVS
jgi:predicted dehydrogenase